MNKEELREKRNRTIETLDDIKAVLGLDELYIDELEEKISVLLSCKNCPENKGGLICAKEYENKCLAQKIEFIKELQQENAELKEDNSEWEKASDKWKSLYESANNQLTKAKNALKKFVDFANGERTIPIKWITETEQFLEDKTETEQEEPYYVIMNMNCDYEICRRCPKSGLFKGTYEECENWIKEKLGEVEK